MTKPKTVIDAEAALIAKAAELTAAREALKRLEAEHGVAHAAVRSAQTAADASLPQCRQVYVSRVSGAEKDGVRCVILRRTPSGILVTRLMGVVKADEGKFKWVPHAQLFRQAFADGWTSGWLELRDVPAEYLPTCQEA